MSKAMTEADLQHLFGNDGLYLLSSQRLPAGTTYPVMVLSDFRHDNEGHPVRVGRAFALKSDHELSASLPAWNELGLELVGGPFTTQSCAQMLQEVDTCEAWHTKAAQTMEEAIPLLETHLQWLLAGGMVTEAKRANAILGQMRGICAGLAEQAPSQP